MAEAFKFAVFYLLTEFFAHALCVVVLLASAGAVTAGFFKSLLNDIDYFLIWIQCYFHFTPPLISLMYLVRTDSFMEPVYVLFMVPSLLINSVVGMEYTL